MQLEAEIASLQRRVDASSVAWYEQFCVASANDYVDSYVDYKLRYDRYESVKYISILYVKTSSYCCSDLNLKRRDIKTSPSCLFDRCRDVAVPNDFPKNRCFRNA